MAKEKKAIKPKNPDKIGIGKFWGWQARAVSMGCMVIILGYLSLYCTDTLMVPAAIVGVLLLVSKVFDAITDIVVAYLIEGTKSRFGKARPYEFCILGVWFCTWLLFSCPASLSLPVKCVWIFLVYTLVNSVFATFMYQNQTPYMLRAFPTQGQIVKVNSYGGIVVTLGCAVVSMLLPTMVENLGNSTSGWSRLMAMFCIPLAVIGLLRFFLVKETVEVDANATEKIKLRDMIDVLKINKYIFLVAGISLLYNVVQGLNSYTYYFTYIGGGLSNYTVIAAISMPLLIVMFVFPALMKRGIPCSRIILFGAICGVVGWLLNFVAGASVPVLLVAGILYSFAGLPIAYISGLLILDCAEYNVLTGHKRMETTMSAVSSFGSKVGQGIGAGCLGVLLSLFGYDGAAEVQSASAIMGIRCLYSVIPAILYAVILLLCILYKLDKVLPGLRAKQAEKQAQTQ